MIPNGATTTLESTMTPEATIGMTIDEGAMAHIMSVLTDLYSDPIAAVIREYSTNGYDAHVEAGITRPIEVNLPSVYAQTFTVRDFGAGLDLDDLYRIYSRYGASTKRESNDVVGMLGLGCKSGLTFTNQFSIVSVKNGLQITALVYLQENGVGAIDVVDTKATDEPSGVLISIPVDRQHNAFHDRAQKFFRFWPKGTVLVDGKEPASFFDEEGWTKVNDSTYVKATSYWNASIEIVMGNVCYQYGGDSPFDGTDDKVDLRKANIIHFAPIGAVQFAPSRESLMDSKTTKTYIEVMAKTTAKQMVAAWEQGIANAANEIEAMKIAHDTKGIVTAIAKWRGKEIPQQLSERGIAFDMGASRYAVNNNTFIPTPLGSYYDNGVVYIKNYPLVELKSPKHKGGIRAFAESIGLKTHRSCYAYLITVGTTPSPWVEWHDWSDVEPFVKSFAATPSTNYRGTRTVRGVTEFTSTGPKSSPTLDPKDKYVVYSQNQNELASTHRDILISGGYRVIEMTKNRHAKFMREFPNTVEYHAAIRGLEQAAWDALSDDDKSYLSARQNADWETVNFLNNCKGLTLLDPDLASVVESYHRTETKAVKAWSKVTSVMSVKRELRYKSLPVVRLEKDKYPIIGACRNADRKTHKQVVDFINYLYTTAQEGNQS
jgi:Histidine kinase-, DNA gyrase B-, and HSP90-like ATPase